MAWQLRFMSVPMRCCLYFDVSNNFIIRYAQGVSLGHYSTMLYIPGATTLHPGHFHTKGGTDQRTGKMVFCRNKSPLGAICYQL